MVYLIKPPGGKTPLQLRRNTVAEMIRIDQNKRRAVSKLFQSYKWNYIKDAVLEGYVGRVLADDGDTPQVAVLEIPKLQLCILGGTPYHPSARKYIENLPKFAGLIFASESWDDLLQEIQAGKFIGMPRYAFTSEKLDIEHLHKLAARIPSGFRLAKMDLNLAQQLARERSGFASNHMVNFDSPDDFIQRGFGFCILDGDKIVSAATTFAICTKGIEIQVDTREKQRGKGLATAVSAQLLIYSIQNHLDPNWDAENERSAGLAKKLGYTPQGMYTIWLVVGSRLMANFVRVGLKIKEFFKQ